MLHPLLNEVQVRYCRENFEDYFNYPAPTAQKISHAQVKTHFRVPEAFEPQSIALEWNGSVISMCCTKKRPVIEFPKENSVQFSCDIHHKKGRPRPHDPDRIVMLTWIRRDDSTRTRQSTPLIISSSRHKDRAMKHRH